MKKKMENLMDFYHSLRANLADEKFRIFFLFFPENRLWYFMQIVSNGDSMKYQNLFSVKNKKNISICHLLKILPRVLSINNKFKHAIILGKIKKCIMQNWRN